MIRSMTGYGRGEYSSENRRFTVEIKSVNHRYNDISIKLPRSMNSLEDKIRKALNKSIYRGKTDVFIGFESFAMDDVAVKVNEPLAEAYVKQLKYLESKFGLVSEDTLSLVARFPEIISSEKIQEDENAVWEVLSIALNNAIQSFTKMRETEGNALYQDISQKAKGIRLVVAEIEKRAPHVATDYKAKLKARLAELLDGVTIDEQRIAVEVTVFADRCCIDEELTRLNSHLQQLDHILDTGGTVGRKLDFLVQEMNREANTIASKANDITITKATIELKSEIEKIREQIQNIE